MILIKYSHYKDTGRTLTDDTFCAGIPHSDDDDEGEKNDDDNYVTKAGADSCKGDSGGPLVCNLRNKLTFVGIVSQGYRCNKPGYPGIYVNVLSYYSWLEESK